MKRIFLIVLDSFGIGGAPDAADFGDEGSNTLRAVMQSQRFLVPQLKKLGLFAIEGTPGPKGEAAAGAFGRLTEASRGKDTTIGHWEIAGIHSTKPLPVYPDGFPPEVINAFQQAVGRGVLCNKPYSGTQVIADYGEEHLRTGKLIVYTSADSVFQIAANTDVIPLPRLYEICETARKLLVGDVACGRVIARPYIIRDGKRVRTADRKDYAVSPPEETVLDKIKSAGKRVYAVGKISDIFNGKGVTDAVHTESNMDGVDKTIEAIKMDFNGFIFTNLVDFDSKYGHRRDPIGYGQCIEEFDARLPEIMEALGQDDVLMICADHGNDPVHSGYDHTREYVPILVYGQKVKAGTDLGVRRTFADVGATAADILGAEAPAIGESFKAMIF